MVAATGIAVSAGASGCSLLDTEFAVGDCVSVKSGFTDDGIEKADCSDGGSADKFSGDGIYRVTSVEDYLSNCRRGQVEFNHEPHDKTYCLSALSTR
ncbi:hypothetical protein ACFWUP_03290 [Nocardia sp. NPDC058658]|uniref:hypothetical protein n=1 Tax=Nocardia sp. NPDC058658 TaxID=3346580 RepID=UPI00364ED6DA